MVTHLLPTVLAPGARPLDYARVGANNAYKLYNSVVKYNRCKGIEDKLAALSGFRPLIDQIDECDKKLKRHLASQLRLIRGQITGQIKQLNDYLLKLRKDRALAIKNKRKKNETLPSFQNPDAYNKAIDEVKRRIRKSQETINKINERLGKIREGCKYCAKEDHELRRFSR